MHILCIADRGILKLTPEMDMLEPLIIAHSFRCTFISECSVIGVYADNRTFVEIEKLE